VDVRYINPFINATLNVLETMAYTKAVAGRPYLKKNRVAPGDVSGVIGLTGDVSGSISVSFTEKSILAIVSSMFGEEMKRLNEEIEDAVGEITNMISGQARQELEGLGMSLRAAIPTVIMGKSHTITHVTTHPIIAIPFTTANGGFAIEVCFER
jgi:chemotaxis protein CheX